MAPGAFAILAPLLRRKKKYEKLETEDPEKKSLKGPGPSGGGGSSGGSSRASHDEMDRLNSKIEKLVTSLSREDVEPASNAEEECIVCNQSKAVMQVAPCGHQSQCRICFIYKIQEAVSSRDLPLRCLICNVKIFRVKNNSMKRKSSGSGSVPWGESGSLRSGKPLAKSVSGYSIVLGMNELPHSDSNHSISSDVSNVSTQSRDSRTSIRSSSSWFSLGSLSSFQAGSFLPDRATLSRAPRAHSLITKNGSHSSSVHNQSTTISKGLAGEGKGHEQLDNQAPPTSSNSIDQNNNTSGNAVVNSNYNNSGDGRKAPGSRTTTASGNLNNSNSHNNPRRISTDLGSNNKRRIPDNSSSLTGMNSSPGTSSSSYLLESSGFPLRSSSDHSASQPPGETAFSMDTIAEEED